MIGSFWNLCRACPSMPVDKLHSEYRSTYRWHEYTGPRQEVIRRAPQGGHGTTMTQNDEKRHDFGNATRIDEESHELPKLEPALPRRKKHPDLAYRHHEFINPEGNNFCNAPDSYGDRARGRDSGLLKKAISKISTEYRLQFAWPQGHTSRRDAANVSTPRKSQSMGALKPAANAMVHRKRTDFEPKDGTASELEPLVTQSNTIKEEDFATKTDTEYNKEFRPFSQYQLNDGRYNKKETEEVDDSTKHLLNGTNSEWYKEVVELRKKAGEYKNRGWGSKFAPADIYIYNKQVELWDQVSRRSSLSALSLASTAHRSYTKEEKNQENTKKSSPPKALRNAEYSTRLMKDMIRHHLERTTGGSELDGLILSPTREKLEPTIPKRDDDSRGSQKNSPKKNSPQKSALQKKNSLKSKSALRAARSHSVGPTEMTSTEKRSPKRQSRSAVKEKKGSAPGNATNSNNVPVTKRPRPSTEPSKSEKAAPEVAEIETIDMEPVVKSPPEPTRVKSPEQIIMISPDPVNWTVPLDTGKTFTVTQNVREGDIGTRPHSEVKAWTPPEVPPPVAKSAPPQLTEQSKAQARRLQDSSSNTTVNNRTYSPKLDPKNINDTEEQPNIPGAKEPVIDNKVELDDTSAATNLQTSHPNDSLDLSPTSSHALYARKTKSLATDVLVKARDRFDSFWRKNSNEETV